MLHSPFTLRGVTLPNRIVVSPMSQYAAQDGHAGDWHFAHLSRFVLGGAGLVFTEAAAVEQRGLRTPGDLGLWQDSQIPALARIADFARANGSVPGIQLAHAGRKASERRPWHNEGPLNDEDVTLRGETPWETLAPSPLPYGENWHIPREMTPDDIQDVTVAFRDAARRADTAGFDVIDVYAGHGFLLHQFLSPLANMRSDGYGGDLAGRMRMTLEVAEAIREVWPENKALFFRISATDWIDGGWRLEDTVVLACELKSRGVDVLDCTTGGIGGAAKVQHMPLGEGFQAPYAAAVREQAAMATMAVGFIWSPQMADGLIRDGSADLVALARELLDDPNWPLHAARALGGDEDYALWKPAFGWWLNKRARLMRRLGLVP